MTSVQSVIGNHMISSKVWDKSARIYLRNEDERPKINFMYRTGALIKLVYKANNCFIMSLSSDDA